MKTQKQVTVLALIVAVAAGGWWAFSGSAPDGGTQGSNGGNGGKGGARAIPVIAETIAPIASATTVDTVGTGSALRSVDLFPAAAGRVTDVAFTAGQHVAEGDVILRLDNKTESLAVQLAEVEVQRARQLLARYQKAAPRGGVPASDLDVARTDLERVTLQLNQARVTLTDRTIVAPFAGTVGLPLIDPGDRVTTATLITTLDDRSEILVTFTVPEIHAGRVTPGQPIDLTAWSLPGRVFKGVIDSTGSRLDPQARTLTVRARVPNTDDVLRPGMSFAVRLDVPGHPYPAVNEVAVMWGKGGAYVWRIGADDKVEKVPVKIVRRDGARVLVDGGLQDGDRIVVEGVQRMREGAVVKADDAAANR